MPLTADVTCVEQNTQHYNSFSISLVYNQDDLMINIYNIFFSYLQVPNFVTRMLKEWLSKF